MGAVILIILISAFISIRDNMEFRTLFSHNRKGDFCASRECRCGILSIQYDLFTLADTSIHSVHNMKYALSLPLGPPQSRLCLTSVSGTWNRIKHCHQTNKLEYSWSSCEYKYYTNICGQKTCFSITTLYLFIFKETIHKKDTKDSCLLKYVLIFAKHRLLPWVYHHCL